MRFKYHGNYCGPGYGDPTYSAPAIDKLDSVCKDHDYQYDFGEDLAEADFQFARDAFFEDPLAATYFVGQGLIRKAGDFIMGKKTKGAKIHAAKQSAKKQTIAQSKSAKKRARKAARKGGSGGLNRPNVQSAGLGVNTPMSRLPRGSYRVSGAGNSLRISGCDFVGRPTIAANTPSGATIFTFEINPNNFINTRLQAMAQLYEKYKFKGIKMHFTANENTAYKGALVHGFLPDPKDELLEGQAKINQMLSIVGHVTHKAFESAASVYRNPKGAPWLFMQDDGSDIRLTTQCVYHMVTYSPISFDADLSGELGELEVEYELELSGISNQFSLQVDGAIAATINNADGVEVKTEFVDSPSGGIAWNLLDSKLAQLAQVETNGRQLSLFVPPAQSSNAVDLSALGCRTGDTIMVMAGVKFLNYAATGGTGLSSFVAIGNNTETQQTGPFNSISTDVSGSNTFTCVTVGSLILGGQRPWVQAQFFDPDGAAATTATLIGGTLTSPTFMYIVRLFNGSAITSPLSIMRTPETDLLLQIFELRKRMSKLEFLELPEAKISEADNNNNTHRQGVNVLSRVIKRQ